MDATAMKHMALNFAKLDKFKGVDFRRWQKKMHFLLSSMSVVYVLTNPIPGDDSDDATDFLEAKYMAEDALSKKFLVHNFTNYKMVDSRPVLEQYNKLLGKLGRFTPHKMNMDESIQDDDVAWWVDSGATVHVYKDRCWFKTYELLSDGSILHMGNESTTLVHGHGCVDLKFSPRKIVSLLNIDNDNIALAFMSTFKLNDSIL
ncbi:hypothetical protein Tco_1145819 [Tanacetum coccineum]